MKTKIRSEMEAFLRRHDVTVSELAEMSGLALPILTRVLAGTRRDMMSRSADAIRDAMTRYEASHPAYRQDAGEA